MPNLTLDQAYKLIYAVVPEPRNLSISLNTREYDCRRGERSVEFSVWDGTHNYDGKTLEQAVNNCVAANTRRSTSPEQVDALFSEAESLGELVTA